MFDSKRRIRGVAIVSAMSVGWALAAACSPAADRRPGPEPRSVKGAAGLPAACDQLDELVRRMSRGHVPDRGADIVPIPNEPTFIGGPISPVHTGPWDHLADVPLVAYGPGVVPRVGRVRRPATMADVAPTVARMIGYDFETPDGEVLEEIVGADASPPRLVVVVIWDGAGWNVLDAHDEDWPFLRRLMRRGGVYTNFEIGSAPSNTPPIHTTLGTGVFPARHGIPGVRMRGSSGDSVDPFEGEIADNVEVPTLADVYDRDTGNRPLIGLVATVNWHLGMIGHGARFPGGDRDTAVLIDSSGGSFGNADVYDVGPSPDASMLDHETDALDRADGEADGRWRQEDLSDLAVRAASPAFVAFQQQVLEQTIVSKGFGRDDVPDLMFTNFKMIDDSGHKWYPLSRQVGEAIAASDAALRRLVRLLDENVGRGRWSVLVTADHGQQPRPQDTGAWPVAPGPLGGDVNARFDDNDNGRRLVMGTSASGLFIDRREAERLGVSLQDIADWLIMYRRKDNLRPGESMPKAWIDDPDQRLFAGIVGGKRLLADSCGDP
ncbi:MAG: hypothetical protein GEU78_01320 [Actinobacteria bacterium]|nr:hypothetical protein [Actinomycetota bacterium]